MTTEKNVTNTKLDVCTRCDGFLPTGASACPLCRWRPPAWLRLAAGVASGAALSMTLSACYGAGCAGGRCTEQTYPPPGSECEDPALDANGDGYCDAAESDAESGSGGSADAAYP